MKKAMWIAASALLLSGCSAQDSDYIPYAMKGMNAYAYSHDTGAEAFAGYSDGNYLDRDDVRASCYSNAAAEASRRHWQKWSYVCCTVTSESSCATKVR